MESPEQPNHRPETDDGRFLEASDEFSSHECFISTDQSFSSSSSSVFQPSPDVSSLRRRRSSGSQFEPHYGGEASSTASTPAQTHDVAKSPVEEDRVVRPNSKQNSGVSETAESTSNRDDAAASEEPSSSSGLLESVAALVIKAISFQLDLFISLISFPLWTLYCSYTLITDPFGITRRGKRFFSLRRQFSVWGSSIVGSLSYWVEDIKTKWKLLLGAGWGLILCCYVCVVLFGLLVLAFMVSGFVMKIVVVEPLQMKEVLNFDYTLSKPAAFVPVMSCAGVGCGFDCGDGGIKSFRRRVIPRKHEVEASVSMTLPESQYNRNLGMFQVRVEFLSADGRVLASKSRPSMLRFRSEPIRILTTMFKLVPLITGYSSESQTLQLRIRGFTEGDVPTSCIRVALEQRAEFLPSGGGIPELYDASLSLESQLPLLRRVVWSWKRTIFVWLSLMTFFMELFFALICCSHILLPRLRPRDVYLHAVRNSVSIPLPN